MTATAHNSDYAVRFALPNYREVLKRNTAAMFGGCAKTVRIAGVTQSAIIFDWKLVEDLYFSDYSDKVPF